MASTTTTDLLKQLEQTEAAKPADYVSPYQSTIDSLLDKMQTRKFSYDFNADPLYQQYRDTYTALGKQAGMNAAASAAANTGGMSNSYGTTASVQANQAYADKLSSTIPTLYDAAANRFSTDSDMLKSQYDALSTAETNAYNQYRNNVQDYQSDRDYYYDKYSNSVANDQWQTEQDYQKSRDTVTDSQWLKEFNENVRQFGLNYALQKSKL